MYSMTTLWKHHHLKLACQNNFTHSMTTLNKLINITTAVANFQYTFINTRSSTNNMLHVT